MNIGIDLDDTLADLNTPWLARINAHLGTNYQREDWKDWDASFLKSHGIQNSTQYLSPDIYKNVNPISDAIDAVREMMGIPGITITCVSANLPEQEEGFANAKREWLARHFPEMLPNLRFSRIKSGIGLAVLIDDGPHHFEAPDFTGILVPQPWNRHITTRHKIDSWKTAPQTLKTVLKELGHHHKNPPRRHQKNHQKTDPE